MSMVGSSILHEIVQKDVMDMAIIGITHVIY